MEGIITIASAVLFLLFAYIVFRRIVRREYREKGRLGPWASFAQFLVFAGYFAFPYLFNPPHWPWFWQLNDESTQLFQIAGIILIILGMAIAFGTMIWFGIRRAFGLHVEGIIQQGPYKFSRNPQMLGGYLLVLGVFLQWPSAYMVGWVLMFALIGHWMIITEEEQLARAFGQEYESYCQEVPRYLRLGRRQSEARLA